MRSKNRFGRAAVLILCVLGGGAIDLALPSTARAIVGRPLTPVSYAGVARRTTRRAVAYGAVARPYAPVAAPVVVAPAPVAAPAVVW